MLFSDHEKATIKQFIFQRIFDIRIESHPDFERMVQTLDLILSLPINYHRKSGLMGSSSLVNPYFMPHLWCKIGTECTP